MAVHAAVFHEEAGRAVLQLDAAIPLLGAVGAGFCGRRGRKDWDWDWGDSTATRARPRSPQSPCS